MNNLPVQIPNDMTDDERALTEIVMLLLGSILADATLRKASPVLGAGIQLAGEKLSAVIGEQPCDTGALIDYATRQFSASGESDPADD